MMRSQLLVAVLIVLSNAFMANAQSKCPAGTVCALTSSSTCGTNKMYCCASAAAYCTLSNNTILTAWCGVGAGFNYPTAYSDAGCTNALKAGGAGPRTSLISALVGVVVSVSMMMLIMA